VATGEAPGSLVGGRSQSGNIEGGFRSGTATEAVPKVASIPALASIEDDISEFRRCLRSGRASSHSSVSGSSW